MEEPRSNIQSQNGISFSLNEGRMFVYHATILELKEPKYIRFLFNPQEKKLAVLRCEKKLSESFVVPKYVPENWDFRIQSMDMMKMIYRCCKWDEEKTYRTYGTYHEKHGLIEYDLMNASIIEETQVIDSE